VLLRLFTGLHQVIDTPEQFLLLLIDLRDIGQTVSGQYQVVVEFSGTSCWPVAIKN